MLTKVLLSHTQGPAEDTGDLQKHYQVYFGYVILEFH